MIGASDAQPDLIDRDYFSDHSILRDPYGYFEAVREAGPVHKLRSGIVVITGYDEMIEVLKNTSDFSSSVSTGGPAAPLPFTPSGSDITSQIEEHRHEMHGGETLVALDDRRHAFSRSLLMRLFTPSKLKSKDQFISDYSDQLVRDAVANGGCELVKDIAIPYVTMVIADLLDVPDDDKQHFMNVIAEGPPPGSLNSEDMHASNHPLEVMAGYFVKYVVDRRANPRGDTLSELANAVYPDGSLPEIAEIVRLSTFLFGAGQDTTAKLLGNAMRFLVDEPGLQARLRAEPALIPAAVEEVLRLEGSSKMTARIARRDTKVAGMEMTAGTPVMLALAAANRDPRRWEHPSEFILNRSKIREHLAFSRGAHVCAGAPLARVEMRIILEKFLALTSHIDLVEDIHGGAGSRSLKYEPSFIIRGLEALHLRLTPRI